MAFCKYCGKQLADGEVCSCTAAAPQAAPQPAPQAEYQAAPQPAPQVEYQAAPQPGPGATYYAPPAPQAPNAFGTAMKAVWQLFLNLFKKPVSATGEFLRNGDLLPTYIIIGIQAILVSILGALLAGKVNGIFRTATSLAGGAANQLGAMAGMGNVSGANGMGNMMAAQVAQQITYSIPLVLFIGLIATAGMAFILPGIMMLVVKMFKGQTDYKSMLKLSAVNSLVCIPFVLLGVIVSFFFSVNIVSLASGGNVLGSLLSAFLVPPAIAMVGCVFGNFLMSSVLPQSATLNQDSVPYTMFISSVITFAAFYLITFVVAIPLCTPAALKAAGNIMNVIM